MKGKILFVLFALFIWEACSRVPITNRKQTIMFSENELIALSLGHYNEFLTKNQPLPATDANTQLVRKVGENIKIAVEKFMKEKKLTKRIEAYKWEFNVVNSPEINAWCMPGGKVVVYTGLLPVMGHEIAHAIARHGNERMSQGALAEFGGAALGAIFQSSNPKASNIFLQSYGVGSTLGLLKYSRVHESEADKLGVVFMAMAGYNPEAAISFWERMSKAGSGGGPEVLSTHPSDETRINALKKFMPTAKKYYKPAN
jgi:Zn-dependent protease with chaperone function